MSNPTPNLQLSALDLSLPQIISKIPIIHFVKGSSDESYEININHYTCTCPDWQKERSLFNTQDIRRACKHIARFMTFLPFSWILPIPACKYALAKVEIEGYFYVLTRKENNSWIDVFVKNRVEQIYDYGYDILEKRWSYNARPRHSKQIRELILDWTKTDIF
jgi:hypothetical protein